MSTTTNTKKSANTNVIKFDFAKYAEEHGTEVTFRFATTYKDQPTLVCYIGDKPYRVIYDAEMRYAPLLGQTMKVIIDPRKDGWVLVYPNRTTHPKPQTPVVETLPKEVLALSRRIKA